jgi:hypothetical protein
LRAMDVAPDDNPFAMLRGPPDEEDPEAEEGEVLEVPTDVRNLAGSLFELIITGFVPEPGPLDWKQFQKFRAVEGGRTTVRRGDGRMLSTADESRVWRSTMESLYGWIPGQGETEPPDDAEESRTNRGRARAAYELRMSRQEELRVLLADRALASGVGGDAARTTGVRSTRGRSVSGGGAESTAGARTTIGRSRSPVPLEAEQRLLLSDPDGGADGEAALTVGANPPRRAELMSTADSSEGSASGYSKWSIGSIRLSDSPAVGIKQAIDAMDREYDSVRETESEYTNYLHRLFQAGVRLSGGDMAAVSRVTERFFIAQAKLILHGELLNRASGVTEVQCLKAVTTSCVAGTYASKFTKEIMGAASLEMLGARKCYMSAQDGVVFSSSEHSGERESPSKHAEELNQLRR